MNLGDLRNSGLTRRPVFASILSWGSPSSGLIPGLLVDHCGPEGEESARSMGRRYSLSVRIWISSNVRYLSALLAST